MQRTHTIHIAHNNALRDKLFRARDHRPITAELQVHRLPKNSYGTQLSMMDPVATCKHRVMNIIIIMIQTTWCRVYFIVGAQHVHCKHITACDTTSKHASRSNFICEYNYYRRYDVSRNVFDDAHDY